MPERRVWPVIMSAPMIRALLAGRKTQTRRLPTPMWSAVAKAHAEGVECWMWVRECHSLLESAFPEVDEPGWEWTKLPLPASGVWCWADGDPQRGDWTLPRPSIHMPRWASRLSLRVEAIGLERLQDISEEDARDEGVTMNMVTIPVYRAGTWRQGFETLWNSLHAKPGTRWEDNPEVYPIRFRPHQRNIDEVLRNAVA